jgi:hypothetical protein
MLYNYLTSKRHLSDSVQGGKSLVVRRKTARNTYTRSGLEHIQTTPLEAFIMTKLVIYFDSDHIRRDFLTDISELIFWQDNQRDDGRRGYEDTLRFAAPDLDDYDAEKPDSSDNRLTYREVSIAIDPSHPAHWLKSVPNRQTVQN